MRTQIASPLWLLSPESMRQLTTDLHHPALAAGREAVPVAFALEFQRDFRIPSERRWATILKC